jgi:serine/threonine protein kinase
MSTRSTATNAAPLSLGRYTLAGRANIGVPNTFRARAPDDQLVAISVFPNSAGMVDRLTAACEACAAAEHPNVLRLLDSGVDGTTGYLVTEWAEGTTLARLIEVHGRLPEANVIRLAAQLGQALDHTRTGAEALSRPRPAAVLVRTDGLAKLIPFGLPEDPDGLTPTGSAVLKPEFAAVLAAEALGIKRVPFAEAVCALGALIHEAITGAVWAPPAPPAPKSRRRAAPRRLVGLTERTERAIRRATDPDPTRRPTSCAELLKVLHGRPMAAGTPKSDTRSVAQDNRRGSVRYALGVGSNCTINTSALTDADPAAGSEVWPLVVQDVSASGIGLLLARRCEPGTELSVEVVLGATRTVWTLQVRVVRVRKDNYGHWMHGCAFLEPLNEEELAALIGHIGRTDG